jgi:hypothetical protein
VASHHWPSHVHTHRARERHPAGSAGHMALTHRAQLHLALQRTTCVCGSCSRTRKGHVPPGRWRRTEHMDPSRRTGARGVSKRTTARTCGTCSLAGPRSVGRFSLYCSGSTPSSSSSMTQTTVHPRFKALGCSLRLICTSSTFPCTLQCMGRQVAPLERGGGSPLSQVSSPINRSSFLTSNDNFTQG